MFKTCGFQTRLDGREHDQFMNHWLNVHAPMSNEITGLRGYVLNEVLDEPPLPGVDPVRWPVEIDGVAQIWFDHENGLAALAEDPAVQRWFSDGPNYCGQRIGYVVEEVLVRVPAPGTGRAKAIVIAARPEGEPAGAFTARLAAEPGGGLVVSRFVSVNASVNLPTFSPLGVDAIVEFWADSDNTVLEALAGWAARTPLGAAKALLVRETVMRTPRR
jgi:uncharacterized protein (TIGR02118 family)